MRAIKLRRVCSSGFFCAGRAHGIFRPRTRTFRHPRTRHTCIMHTQREVRAKVRTYVVCASAPHIGAIISHRSSAYIIYLLRRALSQLSALHAEPASQPAEITFQWFRGFQWFLTARARARVRRIVGFSILCKLSRGIAKADGPPSTSEGKREISQAVIRPASIVARVTMWWRTFVIPCRTIKC